MYKAIARSLIVDIMYNIPVAEKCKATRKIRRNSRNKLELTNISASQSMALEQNQ